MVFPVEAKWPMRIRIVRTMKKQSQQQVADILGTSRKQIYNWEEGLSKPNAYSKRKLAQWAEVEESSLFKGLD